MPENQTIVDAVCENCEHQGLEEFFNRQGHYLLRCPQCDLYQKGVLESSVVYENNYHEHYAKRLKAKTLTAKVRLGAIVPDVAQGSRTLDVGCSIGATVTACRDLGWNPSGVDISQAAVDFCRGNGLDCHKIDGAELPFEDNTFDLITNWHVIEHVPDVLETLSEWRRVLKPGGTLMIETPASNYLRARILKQKYLKFWPPDHLYTFNRNNLTGLLEKSGFEVVPSRIIGGLNALPPHINAYAFAYRSYRSTCRWLNICKSFEVVCKVA